jgi:ArsR family transcriptional regulator
VTCLDRSRRVLQAARERLRRMPNVRCLLGDLETVPLADARFDQVLLFHVLASAPEPARVLAEAARVLRPGGLLALVTLAAHRHGAATAPYGHRHPGFTPEALRRMLERAGLAVDACDVTSRERRPPHFEVLTAFAHRPA